MLLGDDTAGDALQEAWRQSLVVLWEAMKGKIYRSQESVHEFIHLCGTHQVLTLEYPHRQPRDDGQVLPQRVADDFAIAVIIIDGSDLSNATEGLKSFVI